MRRLGNDLVTPSGVKADEQPGPGSLHGASPMTWKKNAARKTFIIWMGLQDKGENSGICF